MGSPAPKTGTGLRAGTGPSLSIPAWTWVETFKKKTKQGARSPAAPLAECWFPAHPARPPWQGAAAPQASPPTAFWVSEIPSQPRCRWSQLDAPLLWQRVPRDEILISYFFFPLVKEKKYTRGPVYLKCPCSEREWACNGHSMGTR